MELVVRVVKVVKCVGCKRVAEVVKVLKWKRKVVGFYGSGQEEKL